MAESAKRGIAVAEERYRAGERLLIARRSVTMVGTTTMVLGVCELGRGYPSVRSAASPGARKSTGWPRWQTADGEGGDL